MEVLGRGMSDDLGAEFERQQVNSIELAGGRSGSPREGTRNVPEPPAAHYKMFQHIE